MDRFKIHFDIGSREKGSIKNFTGNFCFEQLSGMDGGAIYKDGKNQGKVETEETESSKLHIVGSEIPVSHPSE